MLVLGLTGGLDRTYEQRYASARDWLHDSSAVLVDNGQVVAAIEEERLNRIKHTNKAPISAIQFCLNHYGVHLKDIDRFAIYTDERVANERLRRYYLIHPEQKPFLNYRALLARKLGDALGHDIDKDRLVFVHHHVAHAMSAFALSGYDRSLVLAVDASGGNDVSGLILSGDGISLNPFQIIPESKSLGYLYLNVIQYLGYYMWDEYKVMGLAPYGNPEKYRQVFKSVYELLPEGDYLIHWQKLDLLFDLLPPRAPGDPITQAHKNLAASLQEALEEIVFHILEHYRRKAQQTKLCLAGGVAHNCTLNGKIMYSGMFEDIFVQPAAHDAGCAMGAALYVVYKENPSLAKPPSLTHVYLGKDVEDDDSLLATLSSWREFITYEKVGSIAKQTAELLAKGAIIGWVQGRSEFGPRALGNRSILADPRPAENKDIINEMVKKREAFRPFAPSVLEDKVDEYFNVPPYKKQFPFMIFVVKVRKDKQQILGAVTHVDGTARIHTVSRETNERFYDLIDEFGKLTGVYVLLNTSFNNNVEPIVTSADDAIACLLTTGLHYLVIGDYLIGKRSADSAPYLSITPSMSLYAKIQQTRVYVSASEMATTYEISCNYDEQNGIKITSEMFNLLSFVDGKKTLGELINDHGNESWKSQALIDESRELWSKRVIALRPRL